MTDTALLYPVFVHVALVFFLMLWMAKERVDAVRAGTVRRGEPGTRPTWTGRAGVVSNAFHNQLEVPTLFYVVVAFAMITNANDAAMTVLAWTYTGLRIVHAAIYTTYNHIPHRFLVYLVSNAVLIVMWVKLALHVATTGSAPL